MQTPRKTLSFLLAFFVLLELLPFSTFAETQLAYVRKADGSITYYSTFPKAWNAAVDANNVTVGLLNNWDGGRFCVPEGKNVTLELNGWILTRDLASSKGDGEVFWVGPKATLTVYGGNKEDPFYGFDNTHNVYVYVADASRESYTRRREMLNGGIINGGNSDNGGGGIHMKENAKVYLYNVTIAGNKADNWGASYGDGGGIEMNNKYGYLYLEDSRIIYNAARYDGGGVHIDSDYCRIEMVRSHIDHNVADDNGAGIYVDGDNFTLKGDAEQIMDPEAAVQTYGINDWNGAYNYFPPADILGSSVSYNCVFDAEDGGGGIYIDNETALIQGINFFGNIATNDDDKGDGGAIYLDEEEVTVRNCNIFRNKADKLGGGIHNRGDDNILDMDDNTIDSCTIYRNLGMADNGAGGGIYVYRYCDLAVSGPTIVRGNVSKSFNEDNLFLSTDGATIHSYLMPSTTPGADVHIRFSTAGASGHSNRISRDAGSYDIQHFSYDNDSSHHVGWDRDWDDRVLKLVSGAKPAPVQAEVFTPEAGKRTQTVEGGYNGYELIKGIVNYPSFPNEDADIENVFYYSDGFFAGSTNTYNPQLATLSMCLAGAAGYSNEYGKDDHTGGLTSDYLDKSKNFRQFVSDIGCADEDIYINDFNIQKPGADTIGVGIASKSITINNTPKKLVIIGVRGMGYESEWISNMTLGSSGEAAGWASAASQVMAELKGYLERKGINGSSEDTIFWIAGYSRAGATSNLTAKRIVDAYDNQGTHTFAYPIEAPMGGIESAKVSGNNYNCIHNVINQNDIVPWVGTTEMGFIRYGVDHYVPGSSTVSSSPSDGSDNNKVPEDNTAWDVENTLHPGYTAQLPKMLSQLTAVNKDILFDDYYHQATIKYIESGIIGTTNMIEETSDHENEVGTTEHFVEFFFKKLQEFAFKYGTDGNTVGAPYKDNPRAFFATYPIDNGKTFQQAAAAAAGIIFGLPAERKNGLIDSMNGLMDRIDGKSSLYFQLDESGITGKKLLDELKNIWKQITDPSWEQIAKGSRSIKDFLTAEEFKSLNDCYVALLFPILCFVGLDYDNYGQDVVGSAAYNIPRIISNHYPEVTHAWLRSYDYLYQYDTKPVVMDPAVKTDPSAVAVEITHIDGTTETVIPNGSAIRVMVDDVVRLIPSDPGDVNTGESIYYRLTTGNLFFWDTHAFSEPLRLSEMTGGCTTGNILGLKVIAAHNGVKLPETEITLEFDGAVLYIPEGYTDDGYIYREVEVYADQEMSLSFIDPGATVQFKRWEVYLYDDVNHVQTGTVISPDKYLEYFGEDFNATRRETTVTNRRGVSAWFKPVYDAVIDELTVSFEGDPNEILMPLAVRWNLSGQDPSDYYSIYWSYDEITGHYTADFSFPLPERSTFADQLTVNYENLDDYGLTIFRIKKQMVSEHMALFSVEFSADSPDATSEAYSRFAIIFYARDLNLSDSENIKEYRCHLLDERISAPEFEDMEFVRWGKSGNTSRILSFMDFLNEVTLDDSSNLYYAVVYYRPIVSSVEITLDRAITAGETMPELNSVSVTITNQWHIDNAVLYWSSANASAAYGKVYTARIMIDKASLTGTNLNDPGSGSVPLNGVFAFAENVNVTVKDAGGNTIIVTNYVFTEDESAVCLDLVFEQTEDPKIIRFGEVNVSVPHGSTESDVLAALPQTVYAYIEDGQMVPVLAAWNSVDGIDPDTLEAQTITAYGSYAGDDYTIAEGVSLTAAVTVREAERADSPTAIPCSGKYTGLQKVWLEADDGATIRYALTEPDAEGEYPDESSLTFSEYTDPFVLNEYGKTVLLYAYAEREGMRDSLIVTFRYELIKPEVIKLEAASPMIAADGNIECWYSTRPERVGYDENGDGIYVDVPDRYYADETCTVLLDYEDDVSIPAFVRNSFTVTPEDDAVTACIDMDGTDSYIYPGLELIGVQAIGSEGSEARVITVLDSRIIRDAADYGYLFGAEGEKLSYEDADYRFSCKGTENNLQASDPGYCYVTARLGSELLEPGMIAGFYVIVENGVDIIYTAEVECLATIEGSAETDAASDNICVPGGTARITWQNWDGTVIEIDEAVPYGMLPVYDGAEPQHDSASGYAYIFAGWDPKVGRVCGDAVYTAVFALLGDVDCNGEVNMADVTLLLMYLNGDNPAITEQGMINANANLNNSVDILDITVIYGIIANS